MRTKGTYNRLGLRWIQIGPKKRYEGAMQAHMNRGKRPSKEVISPRKKLGYGWVEETTRLVGQAKHIHPRKVTIVNLDKSWRKHLINGWITPEQYLHNLLPAQHNLKRREGEGWDKYPREYPLPFRWRTRIEAIRL